LTPLRVCHLGRVDYDRTFALQQQLVERLAQSDADEAGYLLLLEHPPTITIGRSGSDANVLATTEQLAERGVQVVAVNRGGDVTFHGPGQMVAYPIVRLLGEARDVHGYLRVLEQTIIQTLSHFGIEGHRDDINTGVWVGRDKVAAIGVAVRRWITYHGAAINVTTDLSSFDMIVPCGIRGRGVTSIAKLTGRDVSTDEVACLFAREFADVFGMAPEPFELRID